MREDLFVDGDGRESNQNSLWFELASDIKSSVILNQEELYVGDGVAEKLGIGNLGS